MDRTEISLYLSCKSNKTKVNKRITNDGTVKAAFNRGQDYAESILVGKSYQHKNMSRVSLCEQPSCS